jgi:hypothetical protein
MMHAAPLGAGRAGSYTLLQLYFSAALLGSFILLHRAPLEVEGRFYWMEALPMRS